MLYLDWAATTPILPEAAERLASASVEFYANPSSSHPLGKQAKAALEQARQSCAESLGCSPQQLIFSSGGSESNAIILLSRLLAPQPASILITTLEHPSVKEALRLLARKGWVVRELVPEPDGRLKPETLHKALERHPDTRLVCIMGVSNETGVIQPLPELISTVRHFSKNTGHSVHFHSDLVQAAGKIPLLLSESNLDSAAFSAHKFRGPRGIGLLYLRKNTIEVLQKGGGQEFGIRPGTENVAAAMAMAMALKQYHRPAPCLQNNGAWLLDALCSIPGSRIIPEGRIQNAAHYVPGIIAAAFPPIPGEVLSRILSDAGYAVSTGSACSHNARTKTASSMESLGISKELAACIIRISIGDSTRQAELEEFITVLRESLKSLTLEALSK